jgi:membrane associated rhomboid family serine protease
LASIQDKPVRRWSPLIGGVLLLAFTGVGGERTDVAAHLTGFLAGMLIGWVGCRLPDHWLASRRVQKSAGIATIAMIAAAWIVGLAIAG